MSSWNCTSTAILQFTYSVYIGDVRRFDLLGDVRRFDLLEFKRARDLRFWSQKTQKWDRIDCRVPLVKLPLEHV